MRKSLFAGQTRSAGTEAFMGNLSHGRQARAALCRRAGRRDGIERFGCAIRRASTRRGDRLRGWAYRIRSMAIRGQQMETDLEQGRFAGPVAADEARPLARRDREIDAFEERRAAEGQRDAAKLKQRRSHDWALSHAFYSGFRSIGSTNNHPLIPAKGR